MFYIQLFISKTAPGRKSVLEKNIYLKQLDYSPAYKAFYSLIFRSLITQLHNIIKNICVFLFGNLLSFRTLGILTYAESCSKNWKKVHGDKTKDADLEFLWHIYAKIGQYIC